MKYQPWLFVGALALIVPLPALAQSDPDATIANQALALAQANRNDEALALIDPAAKAIAESVADDGRLHYCANSPHESLAYLASAAAADKPATVWKAEKCGVLFARAYVLENLHRSPEAIAQLRQLVALEPDFPHWQNELGYVQHTTGDLAGALATYRHVVGLAATDQGYKLDQAVALRGIGSILTDQGDLDAAEKAYRQSLELAPNHPVALHELAYIARLRGGQPATHLEEYQSNADPTKAPPPVDMNGGK